jgi:hypothetical protein
MHHAPHCLETADMRGPRTVRHVAGIAEGGILPCGSAGWAAARAVEAGAAA